MSIRDWVYSKWCPFGIVLIQDCIHSVLCPLGIVSIRDGVNSILCPLGILSSRNCVHSGSCPFRIVCIRDCVHLGLCHSEWCSFGISSRDSRDVIIVWFSSSNICYSQFPPFLNYVIIRLL